MYSCADLHGHTFEMRHEYKLWSLQHILGNNVKAITLDWIMNEECGSEDFCEDCNVVRNQIGDDILLQQHVLDEINQPPYSCCFYMKIYDWIDNNLDNLTIGSLWLQGTVEHELECKKENPIDTCQNCMDNIEHIL